MYRIVKLFTKLGLSSKEFQVYLTCYKYGSSTASTLSRLTNIARSSIYDLAEKLLKKGFLKINKSSESHEFFATSPQDIQALLLRKGNEFLHQADEIQTMIEEFESLKIQKNSSFPMSYSEGRDAYMLLIQKLQFSYSWSILKIDLLINGETDMDLESILQMNSNPKIHAKKIIEATTLGVEYARRIQEINPNIQVKLLPLGKILESDHIMFDGLFYHMSYGVKLKIFEIQDQVFYETQKMMFDMLRDVL